MAGALMGSLDVDQARKAAFFLRFSAKALWKNIWQALPRDLSM
jgi:hypothetical protein